MPQVTVVGARGAVGREILELLARDPLGDELPIAYGSPRSRGARVPFGNESLPVRVLGEGDIDAGDVALFAAGGGVSREWARRFVERGAAVVDNSSAFRMDPAIPLVVPEINPNEIPHVPGIIANPNCSTIIMLLALAPLRDLGRCRVVVSTYQAVSGAGLQGMRALDRELGGGEFVPGEPFPFPIASNLFPLIGEIDPETGASTEETKMVRESQKIFRDPDLRVAVTCVRVPVQRCHSEALTLIFDEPVSLEDARRRLAAAPGVRLEEDPDRPPTPAPLSGAHPVHVGRLRQPEPEVLQMWLVGDQLLKGAALNAVQIARAYIERR